MSEEQPGAEVPSTSEEQGIADTLRRVQSRLMFGILGIYALGAVIGVGTVVLFGIRDWFLFAAMYLVIFAYLAAYLKAHQRSRPFLKGVSLITCVALTGFWCFILIDRIPARRVYDDGQVITRGEMGWLWLSIVMMAIMVLGLLMHAFWLGRKKLGGTTPDEASTDSAPDAGPTDSAPDAGPPDEETATAPPAPTLEESPEGGHAAEPSLPVAEATDSPSATVPEVTSKS